MRRLGSCVFLEAAAHSTYISHLNLQREREREREREGERERERERGREGEGDDFHVVLWTTSLLS